MKHKALYVLILALTIIDVALTSIGIKTGFVEEANPTLQALYAISPVFASAVIVVFVGLILLMIYKVQHRIKWVNRGLMIIFAVKIAVLGFHFSWIAQVI